MSDAIDPAGRAAPATLPASLMTSFVLSQLLEAAQLDTTVLLEAEEQLWRGRRELVHA